MVQWLALTHNKKVLGLNLACGLSVWILQVISTLVLSGYSGLFPQPKRMHELEVRLTGDYELTVGVNVSGNDCLSCVLAL